MPDPYAQVTDVGPEVFEQLAAVLETRGKDPQQRAMRRRYVDWLDLPGGARVLEGGCGTGVVARDLCALDPDAEVVGLDPSPVLIGKARELAGDRPGLRFDVGDARDMPYEDHSFDAVIFHTCLCHVPEPEKALSEAFRVLRPGGKLAVFDGDYVTTTFALGDDDPLERCAKAAIAAYVHDPWFVRRLPRLLRELRFEVLRFDGHGYLQTTEPEYLLTLLDRGADVLVDPGKIDTGLAAALKSEGRRRVEAGTFYGFIAFASAIAVRPG